RKNKSLRCFKKPESNSQPLPRVMLTAIKPAPVAKPVIFSGLPGKTWTQFNIYLANFRRH
ncbi:MAG TPA: hypothetical protein VH251_04795, partial [Verrucomicrobiae bacterium]|nr:hypothetical protein [Verrucomicrobiae bacterium]